jgi:hypothetical protein
MASRRWRFVRRYAIVVHRWLGVALVGFFLLWFPSGIGMMYWEFPAVTAADRLERAPALAASAIRLSPAEAVAALGATEPLMHLTLEMFDGRPVYRARGDAWLKPLHGARTAGEETIIYADTGAIQTVVSPAMRDRIAAAWTGEPAALARVETLREADQWTVEGTFDALRPLWKYAWPDGQQVYVSQATGDVVQYTTTASRIGAYLGPIPHWLYFTPLRKHPRQWRALVIWMSAIGAATAMLGLTIGISVYSPRKRYRAAGSATANPYHGFKRWHLAMGLVFGAAAVTWTFSGLLSMEPFRTNAAVDDGRSAREARIAAALRGPIQVSAYARKAPREALGELAPLAVKQLELATVAGAPVYIATIGRSETRVMPILGAPRRAFDSQMISDLLTRAVAPEHLTEVRTIDRYDAYYRDRRRRQPLPVMLARVDDADRSQYYVDPATARLVAVYSSRDWVSRWLYHGLHSLDFPGLSDRRPAWDLVVLTFMIGGTVLSITAVALAWKAVGRVLPRADSTPRTN